MRKKQLKLERVERGLGILGSYLQTPIIEILIIGQVLAVKGVSLEQVSLADQAQLEAYGWSFNTQQGCWALEKKEETYQSNLLRY